MTLGMTGLAAVVAPAVADTGDGTALVRVVQEVNANGTWDQALEPGIAGVTVTLTDTAGHSVTGTTQADGTVRLSPGTSLTGGKYRIEVKNPQPGALFPGFASPKDDLSSPTTLSSNVEFVNLSGGSNVEMTTSFWRPEDYCQKNVALVTACENPTIPTPVPDTSRTLTSLPFNARGEYNQLTTLATNADTGTVWGIGYNKVTRQLFSGEYAKRGTKYGPDGPGAVYQTDPATKQTHLFTTVPNPGTTPHNPGALMDEAFGPAVGKESLGDVDVSEDGKDLYVVNLHDRKLYRYDATQSTAAAPKASYPIPDPGCASVDDWRPFGLGHKDGTEYVGGVCSAESTGSKTDMRAVVQTFNPATGTFTGKVMDQPLNFPRGGVNPAVNGSICDGNGWYPWTEVRPRTQDGKDCTAGSPPDQIQNPEAELTNIKFETNGDMVVGFADRFPDLLGQGLPATPTNPATNVFPGGDINRACPGAGGLFVLDGNGGCKNNATPANNGGESPDVKEFYPGDYAFTDIHQEISAGGVVVDKVEGTIPFTAVDPIHATGNGVAWVDRTAGTRNDATDGDYLSGAFGKARGIGDLEALCDRAPTQIGNRVWYDKNNNGIQDPDEEGVPGATVNLYDAGGKKIGTTITNARGEYYFDASLVKNVNPADWVPGRTYTVKMDNPVDYASGPLAGWNPTNANQGGDPRADSDGVTSSGSTYPSTTVTLGGPGQDDHSKDFGFRQASDLYVIKVAGPSSEVAEGGQVDYDLIVTNNGPSPSTGWTLTDPLPTGLMNPTTTSDGCTIAGGTLTCHGGPLAVGASHVVKVRGIAGRTNGNCVKLDNTVTVKGNEPDPDMNNNTDTAITTVNCIPMIDPAIGSAAAAAALGLAGLLFRRRRTAGRTTL
ncbi:SdrD B-like domain-containing protein [Streptomyces sp. L2]|uniref:SdrD B-like domain-containing protein n=1 Tax=Streptomyces sp. L2 TaxID=2162665 RepID=UPI0013E9621D|nr:SdrD B-like domain-containing protein [Streptomyces sp. L2]